jgi:Ca2+-binding EF-hand superfamily protein
VDIVEKEFNHLNEDTELIRAFKEFDPFFTGIIVVEDFVNIMMNMGDSITQQEVDELIKLADPKKTGKIDYNTFSKILIESIKAQ